MVTIENQLTPDEFKLLAIKSPNYYFFKKDGIWKFGIVVGPFRFYTETDQESVASDIKSIGQPQDIFCETV